MNAADRFLSLNLAISEQIERLADHSREHFDVHPDRINWGHVGDLEAIHLTLRCILDGIEGTGEHAKDK